MLRDMPKPGWKKEADSLETAGSRTPDDTIKVEDNKTITNVVHVLEMLTKNGDTAMVGAFEEEEEAERQAKQIILDKDNDYSDFLVSECPLVLK